MIRFGHADARVERAYRSLMSFAEYGRAPGRSATVFREMH